MNKEEFCLELVNQFNEYAIDKKNAYCVRIIDLLATMCDTKEKYHFYSDMIINKDYLNKIYILSMLDKGFTNEI